jgi:hypothetical protein
MTSRGWATSLMTLSAIGLALRLYAATCVGFGDSEALYASYALHPAPAYVDHPGLIGLFARLLLVRASSTGALRATELVGAAAGQLTLLPLRVHCVTAFLATAAPWGVVWAARALGAEARSAWIAGVATALVPEVAVGLFAMTPDLLLFPLWIAALGFTGAALLSEPSSLRAIGCFGATGLATGAALSDKASAVGLLLALVFTYASKKARAHARTVWPWAGLALAAVVVLPVVEFEIRTGWPMLRHRLVDTQADAGLSLRNLGALVGGQLVYLSPFMAVAAARVAWNVWIQRKTDIISTLLANAFVAPLLLLVPLCLWSKIAEPHWVAPALLALPLAYARRGAAIALGHRLKVYAMGFAAAATLGVHLWVLVPGFAAMLPATTYDARLDISNELYGWPKVLIDVREVAEARDAVVVGPHWIVCAQLEAGLGSLLPVGCDGREAADFADWNPPQRWAHAAFLVFVRDDRFPDDERRRFPDRVRVESRSVSIRRADRVVRTFTIDVLALRGVARSS